MKRKAIVCIMSIIMVICLAGCGKNAITQGAPDNEIITTTRVDQDKTMITVRVEFGVCQQENFEKVLEEKFPDVDIVLRHDGSDSSVYTVKANLEAEVECDLILSRRLPSVSDIAEEYLLDMSSEEFVNNYYINAIDSCADSDGKLYYLPGPADVYGIVYDKTLFDEQGWQVPGSYSEFLELIDTIKKYSEESGQDIVPLQASIMYPDMLQILFNTYGYEDAYGGRDNFLWLTDYQTGNGSMVGHMESAVADFRKLFDDGVLSVSDLEVTPSERSEMMYTDHSTAMIIECQNAVEYASTFSKEGDVHDVAMMPFWTSDEADGDYLYSIPSYYMAINKKSAEESSEKEQLLLDIMSYLSSVEGQEMLMGDNFQMSNVSGVKMNVNDFSENIIDTIERGQVINTFYLAAGETNKQVERQMLSNLGDMLTDKISVEDWLLAADSVRDSYLAGELNQEEVYGQVTDTMTRLETAYTVADMYRDITDADIGICLGGRWAYSTNGYFYKGDITDSSLTCVNPDKENQSGDDDELTGKIVKAQLTGAQILSILNSNWTELNNETIGLCTYYVASGLEVVFNPWAGEGKRVVSCTLPDGNALEEGTLYEVAYYYGSLPIGDIEPDDVIDMSWTEAFIEWLQEDKGGTLDVPDMTLTLKYK
jgi:ABC-type glycerol-3-phosphate transport system substrate-binding protein